MRKHITDRAITAALRHLDPAPETDLTEVELARANTAFDRIVATPNDAPAPVKPDRPRRRRLLVSAGLVGAAGISIPVMLAGSEGEAICLMPDDAVGQYPADREGYFGTYTPDPVAPPALDPDRIDVPGHVPTAVNVPWSRAAAEDGSFRSDDELRALYGAAGLTLDDTPVTVYCRVGERSAHTWFVLHELLDLPDVLNYDGSWVEYGSLVGVPVEV